MRFRIVMSGTKTWKLFWGMRMWCFLNGAFHNVLDVTLRILLAIKSIHAWNQISNQRYKSHPQSVAVLSTQIVRKTSGKRRGNTPSPSASSPIRVAVVPHRRWHLYTSHRWRTPTVATVQTRLRHGVAAGLSRRWPKGHQKDTKRGPKPIEYIRLFYKQLQPTLPHTPDLSQHTHFQQYADLSTQFMKNAVKKNRKNSF